MRLDRLFSLCVVRSFGNGSSQPHLPVLMYHSVSDDPETGVRPYYRIATGPKIFREHLGILKAAGYECVDLTTGLAALKTSSPQKLAVITFDDGYRDFYTNAFPALQEHHFTATMFLPTAFIGNEPRPFKSRDCMTWNEVKELHRAGIQFGSHTVSHPKLVELDWPHIKSELRDSKMEIENQLGAPCDTFAYPFAFPETRKDFVSHLSDALVESGYACCATTRVGRVQSGDDVMQLKRLPANSCDDAAFFAAKLDGAYDWIAPLQAGVKRLKATVSRSPASSGRASCDCGHVPTSK